jgi:DNA invertase Pin-like site-specific DNA recombinase
MSIQKICLYLRVSTNKQETDNQAIQLREFAAKQGWTITQEYVDDGISGGKSGKTRPAFNAMFDAASQRKFDLILFWALDRLSREGVWETLQYLKTLESYNVGFRSFTEPYFDSCGIFKDAVISIAATLAKQQRIRISENTRAGLRRAVKNGKTLGRRAVSVEPSRVRELRATGHSFKSAAAILGISAGTAHKLARS